MIIITSKLSSYKEEFLKAAKELDITFKFINPEEVSIVFSKESKLYDNNGEEITGDAYFFRGTSINFLRYSYIAKVLHSQGLIELDPISRFKGEVPNKNNTSIQRSLNGLGTTTYKFTNEFINSEKFPMNIFPLFVKPNTGQLNRGLKLVNTKEELLEVNTEEYIIQKNIEIINEYRVLSYYDIHQFHNFSINYKKTIGLKGKTKKKEVPSKIHDQLVQFIFHLKIPGFIGHDVAELANGEFVLIESNYAPKWDRCIKLNKGLNIAKELLIILKDKYEKKKHKY